MGDVSGSLASLVRGVPWNIWAFAGSVAMYQALEVLFVARYNRAALGWDCARPPYPAPVRAALAPPAAARVAA